MRLAVTAKIQNCKLRLRYW